MWGRGRHKKNPLKKTEKKRSGSNKKMGEIAEAKGEESFKKE